MGFPNIIDSDNLVFVVKYSTFEQKSIIPLQGQSPIPESSNLLIPEVFPWHSHSYCMFPLDSFLVKSIYRWYLTAKVLPNFRSIQVVPKCLEALPHGPLRWRVVGSRSWSPPHPVPERLCSCRRTHRASFPSVCSINTHFGAMTHKHLNVMEKLEITVQAQLNGFQGFTLPSPPIELS